MNAGSYNHTMNHPNLGHWKESRPSMPLIADKIANTISQTASLTVIQRWIDQLLISPADNFTNRSHNLICDGKHRTLPDRLIITERHNYVHSTGYNYLRFVVVLNRLNLVVGETFWWSSWCWNFLKFQAENCRKTISSLELFHLNYSSDVITFGNF